MLNLLGIILLFQICLLPLFQTKVIAIPVGPKCCYLWKPTVIICLHNCTQICLWTNRMYKKKTKSINFWFAFHNFRSHKFCFTEIRSKCHLFVRVIFYFLHPKTQSGLDDPGEETPKSNHKRSNSLGSETKEVYLTHSLCTLENGSNYFHCYLLQSLKKYLIEYLLKVLI